MKFMVGENGRNPVKNLPKPRFVHHENHMEGPRRELESPAVGGERLTACATRPPNMIFNTLNLGPQKLSKIINFQFLYYQILHIGLIYSTASLKITILFQLYRRRLSQCNDGYKNINNAKSTLTDSDKTVQYDDHTNPGMTHTTHTENISHDLIIGKYEGLCL